MLIGIGNVSLVTLENMQYMEKVHKITINKITEICICAHVLNRIRGRFEHATPRQVATYPSVL